MSVKKKKNIIVCPECEVGRMVNIIETHMRSGVYFTNRIKECDNCGYTEAYLNKRDRRKPDVE